MKFHPFAEVFPMIEGVEFGALVDDIEMHGLREPIVRYQKKILDGRNRFLACQRAKVKPRFRNFKGNDDEAIAFVVSANVQRRHLTTQQRAIAAAKIAVLVRGRPSENAPAGAFSQGEAAELFDVSRNSVQRAKQVIDKGSSALRDAVEAGDVSLTKAAAVVDLPKREQLAAATAPELDVTDDGWTPDENEAETLERAEREYAESIDRVMKADDRLAAAQAEIRRQAAEIAALKLSRDGYLNGKSAVVKQLKKEQRRADGLSKQLDKAKAEIEKLRERVAIMESEAA